MEQKIPPGTNWLPHQMFEWLCTRAAVAYGKATWPGFFRVLLLYRLCLYAPLTGPGAIMRQCWQTINPQNTIFGIKEQRSGTQPHTQTSAHSHTHTHVCVFLSKSLHEYARAYNEICIMVAWLHGCMHCLHCLLQLLSHLQLAVTATVMPLVPW